MPLLKHKASVKVGNKNGLFYLMYQIEPYNPDPSTLGKIYIMDNFLYICNGVFTLGDGSRKEDYEHLNDKEYAIIGRWPHGKVYDKNGFEITKNEKDF